MPSLGDTSLYASSTPRCAPGDCEGDITSLDDDKPLLQWMPSTRDTFAQSAARLELEGEAAVLIQRFLRAHQTARSLLGVKQLDTIPQALNGVTAVVPTCAPLTSHLGGHKASKAEPSWICSIVYEKGGRGASGLTEFTNASKLEAGLECQAEPSKFCALASTFHGRSVPQG